ncbi:MAG: TetR family transcriptional regulator [Flavobacterium sp. MedPE-SWcel]|mgnify:CR=1 FL=1|uniref:TetR/AcrR family transcriptional regulator n=1 Tax=uncultured Flavobacterium sp. TaxID=165435 RepID=UPI00091210C0|nr:TetR/AcrR family transcriptional regulator [uncultured Flavobacterium sp.]OIQ16024.1 MAG: TetR family transcriptional regulator [Flavobacterium sp. MedPE-SWcel]
MKERIIEKATDMFMTLGFKSVTMDDIATELGISKKTIYQHFCNKRSLVEATTFNMFNTISDGIDNIIEMDKNSIEEVFIIREFIAQHLNDESSSPHYQLQKFFPKIFACLLTKQFEKVHSSMVDNLRKGIKNGLFRDDINIEFISRIYFTGLTGVKDQTIFPTTMFTMPQLTRQFLEYHLRGIVTPKGLNVLENILNKNNKSLTPE